MLVILAANSLRRHDKGSLYEQKIHKSNHYYPLINKSNIYQQPIDKGILHDHHQPVIGVIFTTSLLTIDNG